MTNGSGTQAAMDVETDPKKVTVWITPDANPNNPPTVTPATPITLHVKSSPNNPKKIKWACTDKSAKFEVKFAPESPFDKSKFDDRDPESSDPHDNCVGKTYKYSVSVNGGTPLDPQVIIQG